MSDKVERLFATVKEFKKIYDELTDEEQTELNELMKKGETK